MLKYIAIILALTLIATKSHAKPEQYTLDKNHTSIIWLANHMGFSKSMGHFLDFEGTITFDEEQPENSKIYITIKTASISTGIKKFDAHLKSADFLNTEKFPTATFKSKSIKVTGKNTADVIGDFTLHGITKTVTLKTTLNKKGTNPFNKKETIGFSITTELNRASFGINYGLPGIASKIEIIIEAEGIK